MTFFPLMMTRKTLGTGLIASGRNTMIKNTPRPRDSRPHLLGGKEARVNERWRKKSEAARSCTKGCRRSTKNIWLVQLAKRRRLSVARSGSTMRGARRPFRVAPRQAARSWASVTSPGRLREVRSRRWSRSCCMVWTERTYRRFAKRFESSKRYGTPINSRSDVKLDWRRRTNRRSWIQSPLCHRSSTDWLRVWRLEYHTMNVICALLEILYVWKEPLSPICVVLTLPNRGRKHQLLSCRWMSSAENKQNCCELISAFTNIQKSHLFILTDATILYGKWSSKKIQ